MENKKENSLKSMGILQSAIRITEVEMQKGNIIKELSDFRNLECGRELYL